MPTNRIRVSVAVRSGSSPVELLEAIRDYALEKAGKPWLLAGRRPLVLQHASEKVQGVTYAFSRDETDGVELVVSGKRAQLALSYAVTMLTSSRFADHVRSVSIAVSED